VPPGFEGGVLDCIACFVRVAKDSQRHSIAGVQMDANELVKRSGADELELVLHGQILHFPR
jgi:hypothetical protein